MMINILGTFYTVIVKKADEDKAFENSDGYCTPHTKEIVVCDLRSRDEWKGEPDKAVNAAQKKILRHEIVHAFFNESGLAENSMTADGAWARNEEMIDFIAIQGEKIYKAWKEAEAI